MTRIAPPSAIDRAKAVVMPALRDVVGRLDPRMALIAGYQLNWNDEQGAPIEHSGGKALRPTLAVVSAEAGGGSAADGVPAAVAVELVHNFSLLHDDLMDRDLERRHRPTGWTVFGDGQAILAGSAMLTAAFDVLLTDGTAGARALPCLTAAVQRLISGQSDDLAFEGASSISLDQVLRMEAGKTGALLACSASIGAVAAGATPEVATALAGYGEELGMAFQLVDDILGVVGDPEVTGKSSSSDVRAAKRSVPIVAALTSGTAEGQRLADLFAVGPPGSEADVELATALIMDAGGIAWATQEAEVRLGRALAHLDAIFVPGESRDELVSLARYVVARDH